MDVYKRGKVYWVPDFKNDAGANIKRHTTGCRDKEAGRNYLKSIRNLTPAQWEAKKAGLDSPTDAKKGPTLLEAPKIWLSHFKKKLDAAWKGESTPEHRERVLRAYFTEPLTARGITHLVDVKASHCREIQDGWGERGTVKNTGLAEKTQRNYRGIISLMFDWFCRFGDEHGLDLDEFNNPWTKVKDPEPPLRDGTHRGTKRAGAMVTMPLDPNGGDANWQAVKTNLIPFLTRPRKIGSKKVKILSQHPENFLGLCEVLYAIGLRKGDATQFLPHLIKRDDLLEGGRLTPRWTYTTEQGKLRRKDEVCCNFWDGDLVARLQALKPLPWNSDDPTIPNAGEYPFWDGTNLKKFMDNEGNIPLKQLGERLGMHNKTEKGGDGNGTLRPHRFRDSFAVNELIRTGGDVEAVARALGHKDPKITREHYLPFVKAINDAIAKRVAAAREEHARKQAEIAMPVPVAQPEFTVVQ